MGGALTVAAGVPRVYGQDEFAVVVAGYVIMRLAMVFQWLRAARNDPPRRQTALFYVAGVSIVQVLWVVRLALPPGLGVASFLVLVLAELAVPAIAEHRITTTFHRGHVAERYGLFTIIVLGEGVLATGNSIIEALQVGEHVAQLVLLAGGGLALVAGMWWVYFATESAESLDGYRQAFVWGYGHYGIFAAAAAVSSGIEVQIAAITRGGEVSDLTARLSVSLPAAVYVLLVWSLVLRPSLSRSTDEAVVAGAVLVFAAAFVPLPVAWSTVLVAAVLAGVVGALVAGTPESARHAAAPGQHTAEAGRRSPTG
jgi:low temperature requirement protein LtrA